MWYLVGKFVVVVSCSTWLLDLCHTTVGTGVAFDSADLGSHPFSSWKWPYRLVAYVLAFVSYGTWSYRGYFPYLGFGGPVLSKNKARGFTWGLRGSFALKMVRTFGPYVFPCGIGSPGPFAKRIDPKPCFGKCHGMGGRGEGQFAEG